MGDTSCRWQKPRNSHNKETFVRGGPDGYLLNYSALATRRGLAGGSMDHTTCFNVPSSLRRKSAESSRWNSPNVFRVLQLIFSRCYLSLLSSVPSTSHGDGHDDGAGYFMANFLLKYFLWKVHLLKVKTIYECPVQWMTRSAPSPRSQRPSQHHVILHFS